MFNFAKLPLCYQRNRQKWCQKYQFGAWNGTFWSWKWGCASIREWASIRQNTVCLIVPRRVATIGGLRKHASSSVRMYVCMLVCNTTYASVRTKLWNAITCHSFIISSSFCTTIFLYQTFTSDKLLKVIGLKVKVTEGQTCAICIQSECLFATSIGYIMITWNLVLGATGDTHNACIVSASCHYCIDMCYCRDLNIDIIYIFQFLLYISD